MNWVLTKKHIQIGTELFFETIAYYFQCTRQSIRGLNEDETQKTVEIDESLFFRRKYNRGRRRQQGWYIAGIERESKNIFVEEVANSDSDTIREVVERNILPNSKIITDQWRSYLSVFQNNNNFNHFTVNHSFHFVSPEDPEIHRQNIECLWSVLKRILRKKMRICKTTQFLNILKIVFF